MKKNKRLVIVVLVIVALVIAYIIGKNVGSRFFGQNIEQTGKNGNNTSQSTTIKDNTTQSPSTVEPSSTQEQSGDNTGHIRNVKAKAIYISGDSAGSSKKLDEILSVIKGTEVNAVVLDIKENGKVNYKTNIQEVLDIGAYYSNAKIGGLYDIDAVIKKLHDNNLYVIGRIVCFRDNMLATKRPELAIKQPNGALWKEISGKDKSGKKIEIAWANPYNSEVWKYNINIAKEAISRGVDEIQFDYVRFPSAKASNVDYGTAAQPKADEICGFLDMAHKEIKDVEGIPISADVFGIICESPKDGENIGQVLERLGKYIDYISPMVYPSHFANESHGTMGNGVGQNINGVKFTAPDLKPYEVVYNTLLKAKNRSLQVTDFKAKFRPYLQNFTATYLPDGYYQEYGAAQIKQQIKAVKDLGFDEWILWSSKNIYIKDAFEKK